MRSTQKNQNRFRRLGEFAPGANPASSSSSGTNGSALPSNAAIGLSTSNACATSSLCVFSKYSNASLNRNGLDEILCASLARKCTAPASIHSSAAIFAALPNLPSKDCAVTCT